jgi:membrane protease YdiL (CAAX protease family)
VASGWVLVCSLAGLASFGHDGRGLRTIRTLVGTAFGEELVHRGVLLAVWAGTGVAGWVVVAANIVTFGFWHIAGASCWLVECTTDSCRFQWAEVLGPGGLAVMLVWVRLRFASILAPAVFHAASNIIGVFRAPKLPC